MHKRRIIGQAGTRIGDWFQHLVLHIDQSRGTAREILRLRHDPSDHVTCAAGDFPHRHEGRPILLDQPHIRIARHVGRGDHAMHARQGCRRTRIDREDFGPWMIRESDRAEHHVRDRHVVDEFPITKHGIVSRVARQIGANLTREIFG